MKALVYGGAFNPPTIAHIQLADFARKASGYEKVIFVPSKMRYIEEDQKKDFAFDDEKRLAMLKAVAKTHPWMEVSDYELKAESQPRTYITLCHLKELGYECSLLFGSDKLPELSGGWKYIDEITHEFGIFCMARNNESCEEIIENDPYLKSLSEFITIIHTPSDYQDISSSKVRALYSKALEIIEEMNAMVPEEIRECLFVKG